MHGISANYSSAFPFLNPGLEALLGHVSVGNIHLF